MEQQQRFPLSWPAGWKRTAPHERTRANFGKRSTTYSHSGISYSSKHSLTVSQALDRLTGELDRLGAGGVVISTNITLRLDGLPRSGQAEPQDPGAAVYFTLRRKPTVLACDRWTRVADNLAALAAHIDCLRGIDRYGVGTIEQAFTGYQALPPSAEDWRTVFGLTGTPTMEQVNAAYRRLSLLHHPDTTGGDEHMSLKLNLARDAARVELEG